MLPVPVPAPAETQKEWEFEKKSRQFRLLTANNAAVAGMVLRMSCPGIPSVHSHPITDCIVNAFAWCTALPVSVPAVHATTFRSFVPTSSVHFRCYSSAHHIHHPHYVHPYPTIHFPPVTKRPPRRKKFASHSNASRAQRPVLTITQMPQESGGLGPALARTTRTTTRTYRLANDCDFQFFLPHLSRVERVPWLMLWMHCGRSN